MIWWATPWGDQFVAMEMVSSPHSPHCTLPICLLIPCCCRAGRWAVGQGQDSALCLGLPCYRLMASAQSSRSFEDLESKSKMLSYGLAYQPRRGPGPRADHDGIENREECLLLWLKLIYTVLQKTLSTHLKIRLFFILTFTISPLPLCYRKYLF